MVFDVGAHAGQFAKLFAGLAPRGVVYAFEPSPYALSVLKPALAFNRVRNVRIIPYGLSDMDGEAVLKTPIKSAAAWASVSRTWVRTTVRGRRSTPG